MPANNVNCEALRLVCEQARQMVELKKLFNILNEDTNPCLSELETSLWILEGHVEEFDADLSKKYRRKPLP